MTISHQSLRTASLVMLTVQTAGFVLMAKKSRTPDRDGHLYRTSTAVFVMELVKFIISSATVAVREKLSLMQRRKESQYRLLSEELDKVIVSGGQDDDEGEDDEVPRQTSSLASIFDRSAAWLIVPSAAYAVQNALQLKAAGYLEPAVFQVFNQAKLFMTAVFAYVMMNRVLSLLQWLSILALAIGIAVVQMAAGEEPALAAAKHSGFSDVTIGFALMGVVAVVSGFAGVFMEMVLKSPSSDFWVVNAQMSLFGMAPAIVLVFAEGIQLGSLHIFEYFHGWAIATTLMNAIGGLLVAMVIKYADSIIKGFAIAAAVVLTIIVNITLLGAVFTLPCLLGTFLVLGSVLMYNLTSLKSRSTERSDSDSKEEQC